MSSSVGYRGVSTTHQPVKGHPPHCGTAWTGTVPNTAGEGHPHPEATETPNIPPVVALRKYGIPTDPLERQHPGEPLQYDVAGHFSLYTRCGGDDCIDVPTPLDVEVVRLPGRTLEDAFTTAKLTRWAGIRSYRVHVSQTTRAIADLKTMGITLVEEVTADVIIGLVTDWRADGTAPATINKRLNCLSVLGVKVTGLRARVPKTQKWWLRPDQQEAAVAWLEARGYHRMAAFIRWTTRTGLRIEESLRVEPKLHIDYRQQTLLVPGTKTNCSLATIAVSLDTLMLVPKDGFQLTYAQVWECWCTLREAMGWPRVATPKAMRRSAARYLHITLGMPLEMTRDYLRQESIQTTMGYLRIVGGMGVDEQRRFIR